VRPHALPWSPCGVTIWQERLCIRGAIRRQIRGHAQLPRVVRRRPRRSSVALLRCGGAAPRRRHAASGRLRRPCALPRKQASSERVRACRLSEFRHIIGRWHEGETTYALSGMAEMAWCMQYASGQLTAHQRGHMLLWAERQRYRYIWMRQARPAIHSSRIQPGEALVPPQETGGWQAEQLVSTWREVPPAHGEG